MEGIVDKMFTRSSLEIKQDYKRQLDSADISVSRYLRHVTQGYLGKHIGYLSNLVLRA